MNNLDENAQSNNLQNEPNAPQDGPERTIVIRIVGKHPGGYENALGYLKKCGDMKAVIINSNWNGKNMYVGIHYPQPGDFMTKPYLYIKDAQGDRIPWLASQQDMQSNGWLPGILEPDSAISHYTQTYEQSKYNREHGLPFQNVPEPETAITGDNPEDPPDGNTA